MRQIGLDLPVIKKVLAREVNLADVAATHADALEAPIRTLRLRHAVLRAVPARGSQPGYGGRPRRRPRGTGPGASRPRGGADGGAPHPGWTGRMGGELGAGGGAGLGAV